MLVCSYYSFALHWPLVLLFHRGITCDQSWALISWWLLATKYPVMGIPALALHRCLMSHSMRTHSKHMVSSNPMDNFRCLRRLTASLLGLGDLPQVWNVLWPRTIAHKVPLVGWSIPNAGLLQLCHLSWDALSSRNCTDLVMVYLQMKTCLQRMNDS